MRRKLTGRGRILSLGGLAVSIITAVTALTAGGAVSAAQHGSTPPTRTPIKHVIVIIGENHSFDNVYATYQAPKGQHVRNLLSEGVITKNGGLGPNWRKAAQLKALNTKKYAVSPKITGAYKTLPRPNTTYVPTGCDGQRGNVPDKRFPADLADAPYQITKYVPYFDTHLQYTGGCEFYGAFVGDPLHRFYQMYQQTSHRGKLNVWAANTAGDDNGAKPPAPIFQGGLQMGYYNMANGDAPILRNLSQHYAISDNYHQAVQGGTGANHIALGTGFAASYQNKAGKAVPPPANEIENPNPKPGTNNNYSQDGYAGGSYSECADHSQPGVGPVFSYLNSLPYKVMNNCQPGRYYILNNYNAGYNLDGTVNTAPFTVPPQKTDYVTIGNALSARHISWGYYGEGYNNGHPNFSYCGICDPMQYSTSIMTNPALRKNVQHGLPAFIRQATHGTLPAVTFLKPGDDDGHPGYSTLAAFENFAARAISAVQNNAKMWRSTAIFVTFDESGGYYDSGYIQPVSFFGDGPRVPMLVVSPYARQDFIDHTYNDHVSILKFIEANWRLSPLTSYSADNLPNATPGVYVPRNRPAIGNLMTMFNFKDPHFGTIKLKR
jgi:acid phosphatase